MGNEVAWILSRAIQIYIGLGATFAILMAILGSYENHPYPITGFILDLFLWPYPLVRGTMAALQEIKRDGI